MSVFHANLLVRKIDMISERTRTTFGAAFRYDARERRAAAIARAALSECCLLSEGGNVSLPLTVTGHRLVGICVSGRNTGAHRLSGDVWEAGSML